MPSSPSVLRDAKARTSPPQRAWSGALRHGIALAVSLTATLAVLAFLLWFPFHGAKPPVATNNAANAEAAQLTGPRTLTVKPDTLLAKKLHVAEVATETVSAPVLTVTGAVLARLSPGKDSAETRWDFSSSELASSYADWIKARADVPFAENQLQKIQELNTARVTAQSKVVDRLKRLVEAGTDTAKDLAAAEADLLQAQIQGRKEEFEAQTNLKNAIRVRATLERQLFQAGVDPHLLSQEADGMAIVVAEVPEAKIGLVEKGQGCMAHFFTYPGVDFPGKVGSLSPTLAKERRTLRVFFELEDAAGRLKPGMFAEIGLGTDKRTLVLIPSAAVLHVGKQDFVLVAGHANEWLITEVRIGEMHGANVEALTGLKGGERVIGAGAILLQPLVVDAMHEGANVAIPRALE